MIKVDEGKIKEVLGRAGLSTRRVDEIARLLSKEIRSGSVVEVVKEEKYSLPNKSRNVKEVIKEKEE